ncbi:hypothetical protein GpartN1_g1914.t1 [Galdieria partita]|uniref:Uncharacterized protein n=1 Tax=Galdieria partita TaxID=83374 RepID=A0A9C7PSW9_9RHOD|nr:hypothetical protein GpartN1_g1914.t1 [Galdieria partita]
MTTLPVEEVDFSRLTLGEETKLNTYGTIIPVKYDQKNFNVCLGEADIKVLRNKFNDSKLNLVINNLSNAACDFLYKLDSFFENTDVVISKKKRGIYSPAKKEDSPLYADFGDFSRIANVADDGRLTVDVLCNYGGWVSAVPVINFSCLMFIGNKISLKKRCSGLLVSRFLSNESDGFLESLKSQMRENHPDDAECLKEQIGKFVVDTLDFDEQ